eukprot:5776901-Prymnesium_polylepis.1
MSLALSSTRVTSFLMRAASSKSCAAAAADICLRSSTLRSLSSAEDLRAASTVSAPAAVCADGGGCDSGGCCCNVEGGCGATAVCDGAGACASTLAGGASAGAATRRLCPSDNSLVCVSRARAAPFSGRGRPAGRLGAEGGGRRGSGRAVGGAAQ